MLNHITVAGRLTRDPELRRTQSGVAVASFTVAVDQDYKHTDTGERDTDFIPVVAWRGTGEFAARYLTRGRMAIIDGRLQIRNYTDKDGNKRTIAEIVADNIYFADSKRSEGKPEGEYTGPAPVEDVSAEDFDDGQLPF